MVEKINMAALLSKNLLLKKLNLNVLNNKNVLTFILVSFLYHKKKFIKIKNKIEQNYKKKKNLKKFVKKTTPF
jgi:hypothetical protein